MLLICLIFTDREQEVVTKVPLLGDIPILNWFFKSKSTLNTKEELLVFITPTIIKGASKAQENLDIMIDKMKKTGEAEFEGIFGDMGEEEVPPEE